MTELVPNPQAIRELWCIVYDGPIIDAHTHPMLGLDDQIVGQPHPPQAYRSW